MSISSVESRADAQETLMLDLETLDSNLTYRWVFNSPLNIAKRVSQGYRLVSRKSDGIGLVVEGEKKPDDNIYNGDSVLMCCDKVAYQKRRDRSVQIADARLDYPKDEFRRRHLQSGARNSRILDDEEGE
jgi:hypothetical protein